MAVGVHVASVRSRVRTIASEVYRYVFTLVSVFQKFQEINNFEFEQVFSTGEERFSRVWLTLPHFHVEDCRLRLEFDRF
jgi:hypothetical protein